MHTHTNIILNQPSLMDILHGELSPQRDKTEHLGWLEQVGIALKPFLLHGS